MSDDLMSEYDIAVSFAGEDRRVVEEFTALLKDAGLYVFYDNDFSSDLWGQDLYQYLDEIYSKKAKFCVVFISKWYAEKRWTNHELKSAQERAFRKNEPYILPVKLDDTEIPGIRSTTGYLDFRKMTVSELAKITIKKVKDNGGGDKPIEAKPRANFNIKREFTDLERNRFLSDSFKHITDYIEKSLDTLSDRKDIDYECHHTAADNFVVRVYRNGKMASEGSIRIGGFGRHNQILYSADPKSINSYNESFSVDNDGKKLFLKSAFENTNKQLTEQNTAEILLNKFLRPLQ